MEVDGGDWIADRMKGAAVTQQTAILLAVLMVAVVTPVVLSLAVGTTWDHVEHRSIPDDSTSLQYVDFESCGISFGPTTVSVFGHASNQSLRVFPPPNFATNMCGNPYTIQIDDSIFNASSSPGGNGSISMFEHVAYGGLFVTAADCVGDWRYDFEMKVDGVSVVSRNSLSNNACLDFNTTTAAGQTVYYMYALDMKLPFTIVESQMLESELSNCAGSCNVTITYSNVNAHGFPVTSNPHFPLDDFAYHQVTTHVADPDENSFTVSVVNLAFAVVYLLIAIASTPLWDPWKSAVMSA